MFEQQGPGYCTNAGSTFAAVPTSQPLKRKVLYIPYELLWCQGSNQEIPYIHDLFPSKSEDLSLANEQSISISKGICGKLTSQKINNDAKKGQRGKKGRKQLRKPKPKYSLCKFFIYEKGCGVFFNKLFRARDWASLCRCLRFLLHLTIAHEMRGFALSFHPRRASSTVSHYIYKHVHAEVYLLSCQCGKVF